MKSIDILADMLVNMELDFPCVYLHCKDNGWCEKHCKTEEGLPSRKCWRHYAKVRAKNESDVDYIL